MAMCDMCGNTADYRAVIEGVELNVCKKCSRYGRIIKGIEPKEPDSKKSVYAGREKNKKEKDERAEPEITEIIVPDYDRLIRGARERIGLTQKEVAKAVSEKESLIHSLEVGKYEPSMKIAKKLEKFLKIKLIKELDEKADAQTTKKSEGLTIGDFIRVKK